MLLNKYHLTVKINGKLSKTKADQTAYKYFALIQKLNKIMAPGAIQLTKYGKKRWIDYEDKRWMYGFTFYSNSRQIKSLEKLFIKDEDAEILISYTVIINEKITKEIK